MFLAGDIGGTRSRFYAIDDTGVVFEEVYASQEHTYFISLVEEFLKKTGMRFSKCVFGVAGVVIDGHCKTTNLPWEISLEEIKKVLGISEAHLINDLELLTYGLFELPHERLEVFNKGLKNEGPLLLVCPGTGLGVAMADPHSFKVWPTEAGHADFAPVTRQEIALLEYFLDRWGHVSVERFVSGSGLLNVYEFLCAKHGSKKHYSSSEELTEAAFIENSGVAKEACLLFLDMLSSSLGNVALNYLPFKGIYVCGALMRRLYPLIEKNKFLANMADKGRFQLLIQKIPLYLVKEPKLAVMGAGVFFKNLAKIKHG